MSAAKFYIASAYEDHARQYGVPPLVKTGSLTDLHEDTTTWLIARHVDNFVEGTGYILERVVDKPRAIDIFDLDPEVPEREFERLDQSLLTLSQVKARMARETEFMEQRAIFFKDRKVYDPEGRISHGIHFTKAVETPKVEGWEEKLAKRLVKAAKRLVIG